MSARKDTQKTVDIIEIKRGRAEFCLLGTTPTITNRLPEKARRELFMPAKGKKKTGLKHDPYEEFWSSPYTLREGSAPTYLACLNSQFKGMICEAGIGMEGVYKTTLQRHVTVLGNRIPLYGIPEMFITIARQAGKNGAPDPRTRLIIPEWACKVVVEFTQPILNAKSIANLVAAAGQTQGLGDWRVGKGGYHGQFIIVPPNDPEFKRRMKQGRKQQIAAMLKPAYHDEETEELMSWAIDEAERRGDELTQPVQCAKARGLKTLGLAA